MLRFNDENYLDRTTDPSLKSIQYVPLKRSARANVCIVGAGLAGLSTAFQLAARGVKDIVVLEASDIASGASGLNGGFLCNDYSLPYSEMIKRYGYDKALEFRFWASNAKVDIRKFIAKTHIPCGPIMPGSIEVCFDAEPGQCDGFKDKEKMLRETFSMDTHYIDAKNVRRLCSSDRYSAGILHRDSFQFHTPNYLRGLAWYLSKEGVRIYEHSPVMKVLPSTNDGKPAVQLAGAAQVEANHIILACNQNIEGAGHNTPRSYTIDYVLVTEPLSAQQKNKTFKNPYRSKNGSFAVFDSRERCSYYRILPNDSLMWGANFNDTLARAQDEYVALLRDEIRKTYPHLDAINIISAWSGAIEENPATDMPRIARHAPNIWEASAFGGEGLIATMTAGELIASAIVDNDDRYQMLGNPSPV